jgi:hypothetical protein
MANPIRMRSLLPLGALALAAVVGGCVAYPAYSSYPSYGSGYGYERPYYSGTYVGVGGGWQDRGWRDGGWHDRGWHDRGWRH